MAAIFTDANFETSVLANDQISMIDFWATWCPPCIALGATIDALAKTYEGQINIGKLNVDENPEVSATYGVTNLPVVLFLKNGVIIDKQVGMAPRAVYEKKIQTLLAL